MSLNLTNPLVLSVYRKDTVEEYINYQPEDIPECVKFFKTNDLSSLINKWPGGKAGGAVVSIIHIDFFKDSRDI